MQIYKLKILLDEKIKIINITNSFEINSYYFF